MGTIHVVAFLVLTFTLTKDVHAWTSDEILAHVRKLTTTHPFPSPDTRFNFHKSMIGGYGPRRNLQSVPSCEWYFGDDTCYPSREAIISMLDQADNPVATFFSQVLSCTLLDNNDCEKQGCVWYEDVCDPSFEMWDVLTNTTCVENVRYLIDRREWTLQCHDIEDSESCNRHDHCLWDDHFDCVFDRWAYYFGIESENGFPEGFGDISKDRGLQLEKYFNETYDSNNSEETLNKIMNAPLPEYTCPANFSGIVCKYVEAISIIHQTEFYCDKKHATMNSCDSDTLCSFTKDSNDQDTCMPSKLQYRRAIIKGEEVIVSRIIDVNARLYERKHLHCVMQENEYSCNDECHWLMFEQTCVLDEQWITKQIHDLIGNSDDPVCKYFDIDTTSGCALLRKEVSCMSDDCCTWVASQDYCGADADHLLEYTLEISGRSSDYKNTERNCKAATTEAECNAVPRYDRSDSVSHSSEEGSATYSANSENARSKSSGKAQLWWMLLVPAAILVGVGVYIWKKREILIDGAKAVRAGYEHVDMQDM